MNNGTVRHVASLIEHHLHAQGLAAGDPYLTADELGREFSVHSTCAGRAMKLLSKRGVLVRKRGAGTFVGPKVRSPCDTQMLRTIHLFVSPNRTRLGFPYAELIEGIQESTGCPNMCFHLLPPTGQVEFIRALLDRDRSDGTPSGCVLIGCLREIQETVLASGSPAVVFGGVYPSTSRLSSLGSDQFKVGYLLAEYLLKRGHRRLALVTRETWLASDNVYHDGICRAIHEAETDCRGIVIRSVPTTTMDLASAMIAQLFKEQDRPTGLICRSLTFANATLDAAAEAGLKVPQDIEIVYDHWARQSQIGLPHVYSVLSYGEMARMVGRMLTEIMAGNRLESEHRTIDVRLAQ